MPSMPIVDSSDRRVPPVLRPCHARKGISLSLIFDIDKYEVLSVQVDTVCCNGVCMTNLMRSFLDTVQ
jgi:hypothetical protein